MIKTHGSEWRGQEATKHTPQIKHARPLLRVIYMLGQFCNICQNYAISLNSFVQCLRDLKNHGSSRRFLVAIAKIKGISLAKI